MKIRLVSDLHLDINAEYGLDFKDEGLEDMFTVVAGDICGDPHKAAQWVKRNISRGAFVSGNHDIYDTSMPLEDVKAFFASEFPLSSDVTYFDNDVGVVSKSIGENVLLVADVMYTDYKLKARYRNPTGDVKRNMELADPWRSGNGGMNDFNYGTCKKTWPKANGKESPREHRLVPEFYLEHHEKAFKAMTDVVESNPSRDIIIVTHHCLSPRCIDYEHEDSSFVASYVSDKESWIASHENIKCVCSGHIHTRRTFKVGNATYVMNALGYCNDHFKQWSAEAKVYVPWTPNCIIDTSTWSVEFKPHEMQGWVNTYDKHIEKLNKMFPFFL